MNNITNLTITPISKDTSKPSNIDYNEQLLRVSSNNFQWCWDDSEHNKAKIGEHFAFYFHGKKVIIHKIIDVKPPSLRLPSWSKNVGQCNRNVLTLSEPLLELTWSDWQILGAPEKKMGTYTTKISDWPRLYEHLKNTLDCKKSNIKLIIENDDSNNLNSLELEEKKLLEKLEKIQNLKKIALLKNEKANLLNQIKIIEKQIEKIDNDINEIN